MGNLMKNLLFIITNSLFVMEEYDERLFLKYFILLNGNSVLWRVKTLICNYIRGIQRIEKYKINIQFIED